MNWTAIDERCHSKWLCFDSDTDDGDLDKLEIALKSWGLDVIREGRRPGRAGHMWILFDQPVKASKLIVLGNAMMSLAKVRPATADYPHGIELFPKSATALSQVRGPLGINRKPEANNCRGWFDGAELNIYTQLEWLAVQPLNRAEDAIREDDKHKQIPKQTKPSLKRQHRKTGKFRRINILEYVDHRKSGQGFIAQCPLCAIEGHDRHRDNLRITADGLKFCCVYGGPAQVHKTDDILNALLARRTVSHTERIA